MSRAIDPQQSIYINSNHFDEELILSCEGKLEEGINEHADDIITAIKAGSEGVKKSDLKGGIFYLHSNIAENCFNYREIMLISIFLGISLINNNLQNLSIEALIDKMTKHTIFGSRRFLEELFCYENRKFNLTVGTEKFEVPLEKQNKLVFCQVDLAKLDIKF